MKIITYLVVSLLLFCCKTDNENKLEQCQLIIDIFDQSEIEDLTKVLDFFNKQISFQQKNEHTDVIESYQSFFKRMSEAAMTGNMDIDIPYQKQKEMYSQISENTFNQIWYFGDANRWREGVIFNMI